MMRFTALATSAEDAEDFINLSVKFECSKFFKKFCSPRTLHKLKFTDLIDRPYSSYFYLDWNKKNWYSKIFIFH